MTSPLYQSTDDRERADALSFEEQSSHDIWALGFAHQAAADIRNLGANLLPTAPPLPVVVSDQPSAASIQQRQQQQADVTQPVAMPSGGAPSDQAASGGSVLSLPTNVLAPNDASLAPGGRQTTPTSVNGQATAMPTGAMSQPFASNDERLAYVADAARRYGHDPSVAQAVARSEGAGPAGTVGDQGTSFGALQAHVGGGQGDDFRAQTGLDPSDPSNERALIDWQMGQVGQTGWMPFHGAAAAGIGPWQGVGTGRQSPARTLPAESAPVSAGRPEEVSSGQQAGSVYSGSYTQQNLADAGDPDAWAKCGPVAAFQFAQRMGRNPTPSEVERLAQDAGWTPQRGMAGFASEAQVLQGMGIAARSEQGVNWDKVITDVSRGNPVILQLPGHDGHYITAQGYDPQTGKIDFGSTVGDLAAAGHKTRFTPSELEGLGWGTPNASLYVDNPATPAPSVAAGRSAPTAASSPSDAASPAAPAVAGSAQSAAAGAPDPLRDQLGASSGGLNYRAPLTSTMALSAQPYDPDQGPHEWRPEWGTPGLGVSERGPVGVREWRPGDPSFSPGVVPGGSLLYPIDQRYPGQQPYDSTNAEGIDRSNEPGARNRIYGAPTDPALGPLPSQLNIQPTTQDALNRQMYRQPLTPTQGPDTATGADVPYDPRQYDQGAHELQNPINSPNLSPDPSNPSTYGEGYTVGGAAQNSVDAQTGAPDGQGPLSSNGAAGPAVLATGPASYGQAGDQPQTPAYAPPQILSAPERNQPTESPLKPVWDAAGNVVGAIHTGLNAAGQAAYGALQPARDVAAALDSYQNTPTLPQGTDLSTPLSEGNGLDQRYATSSPILGALRSPIEPPPSLPAGAPVRPWDGTREDIERYNREAAAAYDPTQNPTARAGAAREGERAFYQAAEGGRQTIMDAAQSFANALRAGQEGRPLAAVANALWGAIQATPEMAGYTIAQRAIDQAIPEARISGVGPGILFGGRELLELGLTGANGLLHAPGALTPDMLAAAHDLPGNVVQGAIGAIGRGARALGEEGARQLMDLTPQLRVVPGDQPMVMRPPGWEAASDDVAAITRPGHYYRGMTQDEFNATLGSGAGVQSRADYSVAGEGTSFSHQAQDAESYANYGRDDPRKTGKPTYLVEIAGDAGLKQDRDGYWKAQESISADRITRIVQMSPENGAVVGHDLPVPSTVAVEQPGLIGRARSAWQQGRQVVAEANAADTGGGTLGMVGPQAASGGAPEPAPPFFSQLQRTIEEKMPNRTSPGQVQGMLRNSPVKPDEIAWTGLDDWLREQGGSVTKQQVLDFLDQNQVRVEEVTRGGGVDRSVVHDTEQALLAGVGNRGWNPSEADRLRLAIQREGDSAYLGNDPVIRGLVQEYAEAQASVAATPPTKFGQYTLPGGSNYRELLLTLPEKPPVPSPQLATAQENLTQLQERARAVATEEFTYRNRPTTGNQALDTQRYERWRELDVERRQAEQAAINAREVLRSAERSEPSSTYSGPHWEEPNVLAHVRFNDRVAPDGAKVLNLEEVQSDWHQAGRKQGYAPDVRGEITANTRRLDEIQDRFDQMPSDPAERAVLAQEQDTLIRRNAHLDVQQARTSTSAPPSAPFEKTWPELTVKRMIRYAAENGYDRITWPPGSVHAPDRWGTERISWDRYPDGRFAVKVEPQVGGNAGGVDIQAEATARGLIERGGFTRVNSLQDVKDLMANTPGLEAPGARETVENRTLADQVWKRMQGADSGIYQPRAEGMQGFYDQILPSVAAKIGKKFGARVGTSDLQIVDPKRAQVYRVLDQHGDEIISFGNRQAAQDLIDKYRNLEPWQRVPDRLPTSIEMANLQTTQSVHSMDITPQMRESVMQQGQPLFAQAGPQVAGVADNLGRQAATTVGNFARGAMTGGVGAAVTDPGSPQGENESDADYAARRSRERAWRIGTAALATGAGFVGAGALMRRGGGGALGMVGPEGSRYDLRLAQEPVLPGMESPRRPPEAGLNISDQPNAGSRPGLNPGGQRLALPGTERIDPLTDPTAYIPADARAVQPTNTMREALPGIVRQLGQRPPVGTVTSSAGQSMLAEMAPNPSATQRIVSAVSDAVAPWANRVNIIRYAGMLSDTATHVFNTTSNTLLQALDVATTPVAASIDAARVGAARAVGGTAGEALGTQRQVFFSEVPARIAGMRAGAQVGLQAAADILRGGSAAEESARLDRGTQGFGTNIPALAPAGSVAAGVTDFAFEAPLRALAAADAVFRSTALGGHLMAEAVSAATVANGGRTPTEAMIREAAKNPDLLERVQNLGARSVLQENRALTVAYQRFLAQSGPFGAAVSVEVPFVKTPWNVVAQGVGLTPIGLAGAVSDMARGTQPARHIETTIARAAIGTALMAPAAAAYASGEITGPRPTDPKEASTLPPGWAPWSRKRTIMGKTYYTSLALEGPLAMPAVLSVLMGEAKKNNPGENMLQAAGRVALGLGQYGEQQSFFSGLATLAKTVDPQSGGTAIERNLEQVAAQFSPHVIGGGALGRELQRVMGMPTRDPNGAIDALLATFPYQDRAARVLGRSPVEPRQDVIGRPVVNAPPGLGTAVIRASVERDMPVIRAFRQAGAGLPLAAPKEISDPDAKMMVPLTPALQHRWRSVFGSALDEDWNNHGNPGDVKALQQIEQRARTVANDTVLGRR